MAFAQPKTDTNTCMQNVHMHVWLASCDARYFSALFVAATPHCTTPPPPLFKPRPTHPPDPIDTICGEHCCSHRVHTEWQWSFSGVHCIMMAKSAQPAWWGRGVHAHLLSLYLPSRTMLWCMLQLRGQIHSPYLYSTPICTLWLELCRHCWSDVVGCVSFVCCLYKCYVTAEHAFFACFPLFWTYRIASIYYVRCTAATADLVQRPNSWT